MSKIGPEKLSLIDQVSVAPCNRLRVRKSIRLFILKTALHGILILTGYALAFPFLHYPIFWQLVMVSALIVIAISWSTLQYYNELFIFGRKRVVHYNGILSLKLRQVSISYSDIREINIKQSLLGRILNHGTLSFGTASTSEHEVELHDIFNPKYYADLAERSIELNRQIDLMLKNDKKPKNYQQKQSVSVNTDSKNESHETL